MTSADISVTDFVRVLSQLEPYLPISDEYEHTKGQKSGVWWSTQKEHMVGWFSSQLTLGSGAYTRERTNSSARTTYNRLLSAGAFVWMAEALGEDPDIVRRAADAARNEPNARKRPALLRRHLPWDRIAELARVYLT